MSFLGKLLDAITEVNNDIRKEDKKNYSNKAYYDSLEDYEKKLIDDGEYDEWNFEEEDLDEEDYYYEDDLGNDDDYDDDYDEDDDE